MKIHNSYSGKRLKLSGIEPFAIGGRRECYIVPDNNSRCVKVFGVNGWPTQRRKDAVWYKKYRPLYFFDDNRREFNSYKILARHTDEIWQYFPRCYGLVDTDKGLGIVTELIRDDDGSISCSLDEYLKDNGQKESVVQALEEFYRFLIREVVITRDILLHNLIVRKSDDKLHIVMVDGFGSTEVIPVSSLFKWVGRKKVRRKIERFKSRYKL